MSDRPSVYLAGPEVFFPDTLRIHIDERKKAILADVGLQGLSPSDNQLDLENAADPGQLIYDANKQLMDEATALIANLTPFRGPSADAGTIFELGYMIAAGKPSVGFSVCKTPYNQRVKGKDGVDSNGAAIEPFGLCDNLMLDCGLVRAGGHMVHGARPYLERGFAPEDFFDEALFIRAVQHLRSALL
ncbi:nucleoside 2-deoxyribosyltransferase [Marinobacter sp. BGYM27]|uniref:nucleoside 2-deoxyribosyltransferase n=1 Tax=Marinobacter sp. BGYM27 TaxID=2975597 RepID=UPI0021A3591B|nr:nucleoside 2-deoxyribosyltransferase [Marinobacter sp. BGYM27]MDG5499919.1 nucleoside 2-deoxyribosyltransferase [Marinobacter sp. BGYM27]